MTGPLTISDALDKAPGWDHFLHGMSEELVADRHATPSSGQLSFRRALTEFEGLDVRAVHHATIASLASDIEAEFDRADEAISRATALNLAYQQGISRPSAYDLIFVPYFLTQADVPQSLHSELRALMQSLTPGGVLVVMSATRAQYPEIRSAIEQLAQRTALTDVSPAEPMKANADPARRVTVASQVRETVATIRAMCPPEHLGAFQRLPPAATDPSRTFTLPEFRTLAFVNQNKQKRPGRSRAEG